MRRFRGHQNTAKNFVRAAFGPREKLVVGGSEVPNANATTHTPSP